ncbi:MAG TPA: glycoside hydrolase family 3 N-terminal domain-containing protein [Rhodothermia bacterium]|nr:glycoside hydrolase family 3 N-terminal domain-containing protein [Rhodothermia bacterium]
MDTENDPELFFDAELFDEALERNVEEEISMILTDMNLAEKVGQMTQVALSAISVPGREEIDPERLREALVEHHVGSIFNVWSTALAPEEWHEVIAMIQEVALLETRLGIPVIYAIDSIHGAGYTYGATLFPHNLGVAASWDPSLAEEIAVQNARETAACGIPWVFAPVLDLGRQPLWSRFVETFGEDVHLATAMARAATNGYARMADVTAACAKHFVGYGVPRTGHDRTAVAIPENELRDLFVPPFEAAISAGIPSIMVNSGVLNGEAVHASRKLLTGLLRDELGFTGVIVSDWEDVMKLHTVHRVAESEKEAVRIAVEAGIDVSMTPHRPSFARHLCELVEE